MDRKECVRKKEREREPWYGKALYAIAQPIMTELKQTEQKDLQITFSS